MRHCLFLTFMGSWKIMMPVNMAATGGKPVVKARMLKMTGKIERTQVLNDMV